MSYAEQVTALVLGSRELMREKLGELRPRVEEAVA